MAGLRGKDGAEKFEKSSKASSSSSSETAIITDLIELAVQSESFKVLKEEAIRHVCRKSRSASSDSDMMRRTLIGNIGGGGRGENDVGIIERILENSTEQEILTEQVILSILGRDLSQYSGIDSPFRPELLFEPFIETSRKIEIVERTEKELIQEIHLALRQENISMFLKNFREDVKFMLSGLLKHGKNMLPVSYSPDEIGCWLSQTLETIINKRRDYITGRSDVESSSSYSHGAPSMTTARLFLSNPFTSGAISMSSSTKQWPLFDLLAYNDVIDSIDPAEINSLCMEMHGDYLNTALRRTLWMHRLLYCDLDNPNRDVSYVSELHRFATTKRIPATLFESSHIPNSFVSASLPSSASSSLTSSALYNPSNAKNIDSYIQSVSKKDQTAISDMEDLISRLIKHYIYVGLYKAPTGIDIKSDETVDLSEFNVLIRKTGYLIYSFYVTSGQVTHRSVIVSLLLLHIFGDISPTCEIVLRMQHRIVLEILPSHLLAKPYCIQGVASAAMAELFIQDRELHFHIQNSILKNKTSSNSGTTATTAAAAGSSNSSTLEGGTLQQDSSATILLFGWLDNGFWGWFRLNTVLYIWDVILTSGKMNNIPVVSSLNNVVAMQNFFSRLCCILLKHLRTDLLAGGTTDRSPLVDVLFSAGRQAKTKDIVAVVKSALGTGYLHV